VSAVGGWSSLLNAAGTSPRTRHRNPGLDIRVTFEEGRETEDIFCCLTLPDVVADKHFDRGPHEPKLEHHVLE
jgi:hypothetical protein